jgi:hypothetical protein
MFNISFKLTKVNLMQRNKLYWVINITEEKERETGW